VKTALDFANKFAGGGGREPVFADGRRGRIFFFDVQDLQNLKFDVYFLSMSPYLGRFLRIT